MDDKILKLAYISPILAAVIQAKGCNDLDDCIETTMTLVNKLTAKVQ